LRLSLLSGPSTNNGGIIMKTLVVAALAALGLTALATPAANAAFGVRVGILACDVDRGAGAIIGSRKVMSCYFNSFFSADEVYDGSITKIGLDAGITGGSKLIWAVFAPTTRLDPTALEGRYYGLSAEVTPGVGVGGNVLVGGFDSSINLQPISVQGQVGANIAAGIGYLRLKSPPPVVNVYKR
jgi:hypothetical protein